jgi:hypothetical protein
MAVRVLDSLVDAAACLAKAGFTSYTVTVGCVLCDPLGITVYSSIDQSIAAGGWVSVTFNTAMHPPATYGLP